ncbi:hypothetical protein K438DRAFT_1764858 [Mycena galopus ATCC 62051]|nr:hypothetical protein K438DRAFT_1764858 [Mycena galopus ATCC 62051]
MAAAVALRIAILAVRGGRRRRGAGMGMEIRGSTAGSGLEENGGDEGEERRAEGLGRREMGRVVRVGIRKSAASIPSIHPRKRRAPSTERNNAWGACAPLPPAFFTRSEYKSLVARRQQARRRQYPIRGAPFHSCLESEEIKKRELLRLKG